MPRGAAVIRYEGPRGVSWRIKYADADGVQVKETIGREADGVTRRHAEAELRDRLVRVEKGGWRKPTSVTFRDYAATWFERGVAKREWKPSTVKAMRSRLVHVNEVIGDLPVSAIRPRDVSAYIDRRLSTHTAASIQGHLNIIHDVLKAAVADELIAANPVTGVERPRVKRKRWRILQPAEVPAVTKAFTNARSRRVFLTFVLTGLRRSELRALRWGHVNLVEGTLRVVESKSEEGERLIALPAVLVDELMAHFRETSYRSDADYVFGHATKGSRWDPWRFRDDLDAALETAGITGRVRIHDLRHTALTNLAAAGASQTALMETAGHRSYQTTQQYIDLAGVVFRDEAEALSRRLLGVPERGTNPPESVQASQSG